MPRKKGRPRKEDLYVSPYVQGTKRAPLRISLSIESDYPKKHIKAPERIVARLEEYLYKEPELGMVPIFNGFILDGGFEYEREEEEILFAGRTGRYMEEEDFGRRVQVIGTAAEVVSAFVAWVERFGESEVWVWRITDVIRPLLLLKDYGFVPSVYECRSVCAIYGIDAGLVFRAEKMFCKSNKKHDLRGLNAWTLASVLYNLTGG